MDALILPAFLLASVAISVVAWSLLRPGSLHGVRRRVYELELDRAKLEGKLADLHEQFAALRARSSTRKSRGEAPQDPAEMKQWLRARSGLS